MYQVCGAVSLPVTVRRSRPSCWRTSSAAGALPSSVTRAPSRSASFTMVSPSTGPPRIALCPSTYRSVSSSRAKAGTFTLAANQSSGYTVTHDLGVLPDLIVFWTDDGTVSDPAAISGQLQNAGMCWTRKRAGSPKGHMGYRMRSSSGALAAADGAFSTITDTTFRISAASNNLLPGGVTFYWMAAALKGGE